MRNNDVIKIIESTVLSIASSFPVLASISTGWNEYKNHVQTQNIKNIIEVFYNKLNEIDYKVNHEYLESDNLKSLIIKTCFYGKEEMSEEKRKMLSYFLANSCTMKLYKDITKNAILETIIKLSEFDIFLINMIADISSEPQSQNSILTGAKKYDPSNVGWAVMDEFQIIEKVENHSENEVVTTLEYLNSVGVIETMSSRNINTNIETEIRRYLNNKEFEDIQNRREIINNTCDNIKKFKELKELDEEEQKLELNENYNYELQKKYYVTSLGLAIMNYLRE